MVILVCTGTSTKAGVTWSMDQYLMENIIVGGFKDLFSPGNGRMIPIHYVSGPGCFRGMAHHQIAFYSKFCSKSMRGMLVSLHPRLAVSFAVWDRKMSLADSMYVGSALW